MLDNNGGPVVRGKAGPMDRRERVIATAVAEGRIKDEHRAMYASMWDRDPVATERALGLAGRVDLVSDESISILTPAERARVAAARGGVA